MSLSRSLLPVLRFLTLPIALGVALALAFFWRTLYLPAGTPADESLVYAVFVWPHRLDFVALAVGVALLVAGRLVAQYRRVGGRAPLVGLGLLGSGLGLLLFGLIVVEVVRPARLSWFRFGDPSALEQLDLAARQRARAQERPMLYYFRADWCTHCPEFERYKLRNPRVVRALRPFLLVRMDVTNFDRWKPYLAKHYHVHGTPTLVFRDARGRVIPGAVVEGNDITPRALELLVSAVASGKSFTSPKAAGTKAQTQFPAPHSH